jgi:hypothetical protein
MPPVYTKQDMQFCSCVLGLTNGPVGTVPGPPPSNVQIFFMAKESSRTKVMMTLHSSLLIHCSEPILHLPEVASAVLCAATSCQLSAAAELSTVWIPPFSPNNFPPAVLCRRCPQSFVWRCMWPDYRKLIYSVLLKRHFKGLTQYSPQLSRFRGASNLGNCVVWFTKFSGTQPRKLQDV